MKIEYAGEKFCGSQMQSGVRTVQEDLEKAINAFFRTKHERAIKATLSGRTDTGVHALGQVMHFDLSNEFLLRSFTPDRSIADPQANPAPLWERQRLAGSGSTPDGDTTHGGNQYDPIPAHSTYPIQIDSSGEPLIDDLILNRICWALNGILQKDISIVQAQVVPSHFNARHSACLRTYVYRILNRAQRSALGHNMQHFVPAPLDTDAMKAAAGSLLGQHDFSAFKSSNADKTSPICRVSRAELLKKGESELEFWISANHFVYNMVRIIVGTLIEIGLGKRAPSDLAKALAGKDRHLAGPTAASRGLCLYSVEYPTEFCLFQRDPQLISVSQEK